MGGHTSQVAHASVYGVMEDHNMWGDPRAVESMVSTSVIS